jgi:hypothetical protein
LNHRTSNCKFQASHFISQIQLEECVLQPVPVMVPVFTYLQRLMQLKKELK